MKKLLQRFTSSYILWGQSICFLILFCLHLYQFFDSGFMWEVGIRIVFYPVYILSLFFFGEKLIFYELLLFSLALVQTIKFDNYSAFGLIVICCIIKKDRKEIVIPLMLLYLTDVIIVCVRHGKTPVHLLIHACVCTVIFVSVHLFVFFIKNRKQLELTAEEEKILYQIVFEKKKLKEIDGYKPNTISKKLTKCKKRNNIQSKSNDPLYELFEKAYIKN